MTRSLLPVAVLVSLAGAAVGQPTFDQPKAYPPDADALKQIEAKTADLRAAVAALPAKTPDDVRADVAVYLKAAEWTTRHGEWFSKDSGKHTLEVLDAGLKRARQAKDGKTPWRDVRNKPVVRGYVSAVDGSVQPFSVTLPEGYGQGDKRWRLDVVLHGRDQTLTEVKFIRAREAAKPAAKGNDFVALEPYGRGNNAYRWAGESDVREAAAWFARTDDSPAGAGRVDPGRVVLRGFSMGGAGTWHLGLHTPFEFSVLGPGAGFTTTHGYVKNLPELPDYQEKTLRVYDAVGYAENAFNVPVVAYSGEKDPQKAAADNIESSLKGFKERVRLTHVVAPGLEHQQPAEWQAKLQAEYGKYAGSPRPFPEHVRFVTYTTRYPDFAHGRVVAVKRQYEQAVVESRWTDRGLVLSTTNVRALRLDPVGHPLPAEAVVNAQPVPLPRAATKPVLLVLADDGPWRVTDPADWPGKPIKRGWPTPLQGPIDDAFLDRFAVAGPAGGGWHPAATAHAAASLARFGREWDKFFRGGLPTAKAGDPPGHLVLFGDPGSNPEIARVVGDLPITWTKEKLMVNGVGYDPTTHVPVLIYPNPRDPGHYVVINSGHTFHADALTGTNALLYPRLGDWAVLKPTQTEKDPAAAEVVAAGLFDEKWQFAK